MSGYEFDPKDKDGSLRDRFDCYCKEVIGRAAHNLVFKQAQYLILHFGGGEIDPSMMMHEDEHDNLYAVKMTVKNIDDVTNITMLTDAIISDSLECLLVDYDLMKLESKVYGTQIIC